MAKLEENLEASMEVFTNICKLLENNQISYKSVSHEPTFTSEESARARNEDLSIGGKAILMKADDSYNLFVLSASKKINSKKLKEHLKCKKLRFSTSDELYELCKLVPGSVPPFGRPILPVKLFLDRSFKEANQKIAFNAGSLTRSIVLSVDDYLRVSQPELFDFAE